MKVHSVLHVLSELQFYLYPKTFLIRVPWLTVTRAWERYIESAEWVYRGVEEGKKRLIELELGDEREEKLRRRGENDPWLAQLDWRWESRGAW